MTRATVKLWRISPQGLHNPGTTSENVMPSGRQALIHALRLAGLGRKNRVALPEWSSHCVISAIGRIATPIPLKETTAYSIPVDGVLLYEQWGWPLQYSDDDLAGTRAKVLILDKVDSADINRPTHNHPNMETYEVFSLSKLLGLRTGGLLRHQNEFHAQPASPTCHNYEKLIAEQPRSELWDDILKADISVLNQQLVLWLKSNGTLAAIKDEGSRRRINLERILQSPTAKPQRWMEDAFRKGAAPGIFPLLPGITPDIRNRLSQQLLDQTGIETQGYHFNYSGNPFKPDYRPCLAFPIHGQVTSRLMEEALTLIENQMG